MRAAAGSDNNRAAVGIVSTTVTPIPSGTSWRDGVLI